MRYFSYWDKEIRGAKDGKTYYLRCKLERRTGKVNGAIRTHRDGKGVLIAKTIGDSVELKKMYEKLNKKFKFKFVELISVEDIKE